jgi:DNA polymerase-3 subunit alpha
MDSVALTDNGTMYGVIDFYLKAKSAGVKPIIGCELFVVPDMTEKVRGFQRLILLAKDYKGYQNLIHLVSLANLDGFYYRPRIDFSHMEGFTDGLVAISPGMNGPVADNLKNNRDETAKEVAIRLKELFNDDFYLGVQRLDVPFEDLVLDGTLDLSKELDIPIVATNDVYYLKREMSPLRNILRCIQTGRRLSEDTRGKFDSQEMYFKSPEEMTALFNAHPEAISNTKVIADKCNLEIEMEQVNLPHFECPDGMSPEAYLEKLVWEGIDERYPEVTDELRDRVNFELGIINKMKYAIYFLIIYDFLDFARNAGIPIGPGRGSAAGSIVSYALDITRIDPIRYNLLFERFLNPERVSMPDVDLDFCIRRRGEVIDYLTQHYGDDRVSMIITFGTMASRAVVRDVGRVLDIPLRDVDYIAKLIPSTPGMSCSIPEAIEQVQELQKNYETNTQFKELLDIGQQLEGLSRHTSMHAAGVVISRDPLTSVVPLVKNEGQAVTQFSMNDLEKVGLLKMDILGLRNLTVMRDATDLIAKNHGVQLDLDKLDLDDEKTYELFKIGATIGVFQCESRGMRQLIKDMRPSVFEDVIALLALYRPGPLGSGMVSEFISNKSGKTTVSYDLDILEPILQETYGMIVYQEQVMQIASAVGGFSLGQADMLRRAMGKKKKEEMDKMRAIFISGAEEKGYPKETATKIFELCDKFAAYGFNKSHSAAYALISYQTAYLKANYSVEYMTALLSSVLGTSDKVSLYIQECEDMGIEVLPPSVNHSISDFSIDGGNIRFGLGAIKNVGEGAIESIVKNRPYKDLSDLCLKVDLKQVNKRVIESLIKAGAMDDFGDRSKLLGNFERTMDSAQVIVKERQNGQVSMFGNLGMPDSKVEHDDTYQDYDVLSPQEKLRMEKEMLGLYISGHPLDLHKEKLESLPHNSTTLTVDHNEKKVTVGGLLTGVRRVTTKTKREMLLATLEDDHGELTIMVFQNDNFETMVEKIQDDHIVILSGRVRVNNDEITITADSVTVLDEGSMQRSVNIDLEDMDDLSIVEDIKRLSNQHRGSLPLYIHIGEQRVLAHKKYWMTEDHAAIGQLENLVGQGHVWVV